MHEDTYIVLMGGDLEDDGNELGAESKIRCTKAALVFNQINIDGCRAQIIISAGKMPNYPKQKGTLSLMMSHYIYENFSINGDTFMLNWQATNSAAEIQLAIDTIKNFRDFYEKRGLHDHMRCYKVIIVSSWYHLPRLKFLWRKYAHENMPKPTLIASGWRPSIWSLVREMGAWIGALTGLREPRWSKTAFNYPKPLVT